MTYKEALDSLVDRLPAYHRIGKAAYKANLDNTLALDEYFGHPHLKFRSIHVAGTNGKGSVSHMTASILQEAGYRTGLYTSPHLRDFRERIRVNGEMIPEEEVVKFVETHSAVIDKLTPSFFELTMAMAFDYFARSAVDVAVVEVGMGGRLDSTNIITPELSVITNIGHDHMMFLGNTLQAIAGEKAGIIKHGIPVVIGETQEETTAVFRDKASMLNAPITFADQSYSCHLGMLNENTFLRDFSVRENATGKVISGVTPLGGEYQQKNLQTVIAAAAKMYERFNIKEENVINGITNVIRNTGLQGRWQVLSNNPLTICDTGHNKEGLEYVVRQLLSLKKRKMHLVIGFVNDKDLNAVLPLLPPDATYYFTKASIPRALDEKLLEEAASKYGLSGKSYSTVEDAIKAARGNAVAEDLIFIGGSTFIVAEAV